MNLPGATYNLEFNKNHWNRGGMPVSYRIPNLSGITRHVPPVGSPINKINAPLPIFKPIKPDEVKPTYDFKKKAMIAGSLGVCGYVMSTDNKMENALKLGALYLAVDWVVGMRS